MNIFKIALHLKNSIANAFFYSIIVVILNIMIWPKQTLASIELALPFSNHMVLQRDIALPIWGKADPGETITVRFRDQIKSTISDHDGKWKIKLEATSEGGPFNLMVSGSDTLNLTDILVGEVWICSGQSNMQWTIANIGGANLDSSKSANLPNLRFLNVSENKGWNLSSPTSVTGLSATAFYFGRELQKSMNIPVGLIISAEGGTPLERWMDSKSLANDSILKRDSSPIKGDLFVKYIQPLIPFAIKGFIWYQGESNAQYVCPPHPNWIVDFYYERFKALISGWRMSWNQGELPFCFAQIANYDKAQSEPGEISAWADLREAQRRCLSIPNTYMAVLIDIGDSKNLHPVNKWDVGKRLALPIRSKVYGEKNLEWSGPSVQSVNKNDSTIKIVFNHAEGLIAKSPNMTNYIHPKGFEICGANKKWVWADATIKNDTILLGINRMDTPLMVRYAWANNPLGNLFNASRLPASPFQIKLSEWFRPNYQILIPKDHKRSAKFRWLKKVGDYRNILGQSSKNFIIKPLN